MVMMDDDGLMIGFPFHRPELVDVEQRDWLLFLRATRAKPTRRRAKVESLLPLRRGNIEIKSVCISMLSFPGKGVIDGRVRQ